MASQNRIMKISVQIARHLREVYFGENWTASNLTNALANVSWQQAVTKVHSFNTIAALVYHINYYVLAVLNVLQEKPLNAKDKYSFDLPPVQSQEDWEALLNETWANAKALADLIEQLPEAQLAATFADEKYGSYFRNFFGLIEHTHYHLGQIVLIKKFVSQPVSV